MKSTSLTQRQLRLNASVIQGLQTELASLKFWRKSYYEAGEPAQAKVYSPFIRKFEKKLAAVVELQKELKYQLKDQYHWDRCVKYISELPYNEGIH